jgi:hypothetical protein
MTTESKKRTFIDDYPEVSAALEKKFDSHRAYLYAFAGLATLSAWWLMVMACVSALLIKVMTNWVFRGTIELTAFILEKTAHWNKNNIRVKTIKDRTGEEDYLVRHYMFIQDRKDFPFNVFIHKFMKGDEEDIHDHPWGFFHLILSGGYYEYVTVNEDGVSLDQGTKKVWRGPGYWNIAGPSYKHRIELGDTKPWTVFIPFKRCRDWGFWVRSGDDDADTEWEKVGHEEYLKTKLRDKSD